MEQQAFIDEFIRQEPRDGGVDLYVLHITWRDSAHPESNWQLADRLEAPADCQAVERAIVRILADPAHFQLCRECGELNPVGWMCMNREGHW